ncbi:hypothetical protein P3L10_026420 [Capsicum annuum]
MIQKISSGVHRINCYCYGTRETVCAVPISLNTKDYSLSNSWLIPVLNKYVCGSSLRFFMKHVVPLAVSFEQASSKEEL